MTNYGRDYLLAQMANQSYKDNPAPIGNWQVIDKMIDKNSGFAACAYKNPQTNEIIIAYRGTDNGDISADAALARDSKAMLLTAPTAVFSAKGTDWDKQFTQALDFAGRVQRNNPNSEISVTGHSLGGGLAQISAKMYGFEGVTFDPAAAKNVVNSKEFREYARAHNLPEAGRGRGDEPHNYEVKWSVVSGSTGQHVWRSTELTGYHADDREVSRFNVGTRHSMNRIEEVFASAAIKGVLPRVATIETSPMLASVSSHDYKTGVIKQTTIAVNELCDAKGYPNHGGRDNMSCHLANDLITQGSQGIGRFQAALGVDGKTISVREQISEFKDFIASADSNVIVNIPKAESLAKIAAYESPVLTQNSPSHEQEFSRGRSV